jgi:uncharacterized LabA/DUF88 family protein
MDILHSKNAEGFCIVSSDSDYTGLAKRIREEGLFVMGIGQKKTPSAFVQSCEIFTFTENLIVEPKAIPVAKKKANKKEIEIVVKDTDVTPKINLSIIDKAFDISANEDDEAYIANIGTNLRKISPSFDSRTYGFRNLTKLFESIDKYQVVKNIVNGLNHPLVRLK